MKVVQGKKGFTPITITLETEEEANGLWCILACLDNESLESYLGGTSMKAEKKETITHMSYEIFDKYDNVYHPEA